MVHGLYAAAIDSMVRSGPVLEIDILRVEQAQVRMPKVG